MCICFCCCCNCCNSFSSKCIEICILIVSLCTFIFSLLSIIFIKWDHLKSASFILLIVIIVLSTIITISSISIVIYRFTEAINKKRNSFCLCLARICVFLSICTFVISIVSEGLIQDYFYEIDYPCKSIDKPNNELCKDKGSDYNAQVCSNLEYTIIYLSSTIIELCTFISIFLWFNDIRRIQEKVDGMLGTYGTTFVNKSIFATKKNTIKLEDKNNQASNDIDSVNRYINQNQSIQSQVILVKNQRNNNNANQLRLSTPINKLNFSKDSGNFIKNLREEMRRGIESIDEEEDSYENKEDENKKENLEISIYSNKEAKDSNIYKNNNSNIDKKDANTIIEENKEDSIEIPDIYVSNKNE